MMSNRLKLHEELVNVLGTRNVYFQPPETIKMKYPCIVYEKENIEILFADNKPYKTRVRYSVTVIDTDSESEVAGKILAHFPMCVYSGHYTADNLNHDSLILYY